MSRISRGILYISLLSVAMILAIESPSYAQRGTGGISSVLNIGRMTGAVQRAYKDYLEQMTFVHKTIGNIDIRQIKDPEGVLLISDIIKYKGKRRHLLKATNDAEQDLIQAIESIKTGDYNKAFTLTKEAVAKDSTYMRAHFLLAGLYENRGDIKDMARQYRYYLKKTLFLRKMVQAKTGWPDVELQFIEKKFEHYNIPVKEPGVFGVNMAYLVIGAVCVAIMLFMTFFLLRKAYR